MRSCKSGGGRIVVGYLGMVMWGVSGLSDLSYQASMTVLHVHNGHVAACAMTHNTGEVNMWALCPG